MPIYPFCIVSDIQALNQHRQTYATTTKPTLVQVNKFIDEIASRLRAIVSSCGYDLSNLYDYNSTVADALTAGSNVSVTLASAVNFSKGDIVKLEGLTSGVRAWEYTVVEAKSSNILTLDLVNSYDAANVTIYVVNEALQILRELNAIGAAARAEEAVFMGVTPNQSDHAETLWKQFNGSEETYDGIWAIRNVPNFLYGASLTDEAVSGQEATSYQVENPSDDYVEAGPDFGMTTKW